MLSTVHFAVDIESDSSQSVESKQDVPENKTGFEGGIFTSGPYLSTRVVSHL
jgi:hypothetical protein